MRQLILVIAAFLLALPASAQGTLSPAVPVANQGTTIQFSCTANCGTGPTWTCPGCAGSINASGLYTAPATITPQQSIGGWQLHPNNHVFNTRVDSLPLRSDSATLMAGTGANRIIYHEISFPTNYTDTSTPTVPMSFFYSPANNANFEVPVYPNAKLETGWFNAITNQAGNDHHMITVNTSTGAIGNMYQYYPACTTTAASVNGSNVATITCSANPITNGFLTGTNNVCVGGFTGADTYFNACPTSVTAVTSTSISYALTHASASASTNGSVTKNVQISGCSTAGTCNSQSGVKFTYSGYGLPSISTDAAGLELTPLMLRLQEMEQAIATSGTINHALRMTLRNNFICNSNSAGACYSGKPAGIRHIWPATSESLAGFGLNPYGLRYRLKASFDISGFSSIAQILLTQLKQYGLILSDGGSDWSIISEAAPWPANIIAAMNEIEAANITGSTNMEVVDEGGIEISATSGETTNNRETVTYNSTTGTATVDVALMGVAVGLVNDNLNIQAGTAAQQFTASVHGGAANTVTWSWSPAITGGTLTAGGLLTPPATIAAKTDTTITATSTDNAAIAASMTVSFFPTGSIYFRPFASTAYTDSNGHVWAPLVLGSGGNLGCCGDHSSSNWGSLVDKQIYYYQYEVYNDGYFNFTVPNGAYKITLKNGSDAIATATYIDTFETQGVVFYSNQDIFTLTGGPFIAKDLTMNTVVTNNQLQIVVRVGIPTPVHTIIEAIQIDRTGVGVATTLTPDMKVTSGVSLK